METGTARDRSATGRPARPRPRAWAAAAGLAVIALALSACGSQSSGTGAGSAPSSGAVPTVAPGAVVGTVATGLGTIMVDANGKALYVFAADSPGKSSCDGTCLMYWPPVTAPPTLPATPTSVSAKLGEIKRADGTRQLTVDGWPVYTYVGDNSPGTATGQGKNLNGGLWWVVSPGGTQIKSAAAVSPKPSASKSSAKGGWA